jgi:hypothetical protein
MPPKEGALQWLIAGKEPTILCQQPKISGLHGDQ